MKNKILFSGSIVETKKLDMPLKDNCKSMKNVTKLILFGAFLFQFQTIYPSNKFQPGYIISNEMDTSYVEIENSGDAINCKRCVVMNSITGRSTTYLPGEIYGYRFIEGKYYISKSIVMDNNVQQVFLEYLINGIVDVFCYTQALESPRYFISKNGGELTELTQYEKSIYRDGTTYKVVNKPYIGYLSNLFSDAPDLIQEVERTSLNRNSLVNISEKYHNTVCYDRECIIYKKKLTKSKFGIGPVLGYQSLDFESKELRIFTFIFDEFNDPYESYKLGIVANISFPYTRDRFEILYMGMVYSYKIQSSYTYYKQQNLFYLEYYYDYELRSTDLQNDLILRYSFSDRKVRPFVEGGAFYTQSLNFNITGFEEFDEYYSVFRKSSYFGFTTGLGATFRYVKNMEPFVKFTWHRGWDALDFYKTNAYSLNMGFLFTIWQ